MHKYIILLACSIFIAVNSLHAMEIPKSGNLDTRIRYVNYDSDQVVKIYCHYGYSVHIQLSPTERIINWAVGDKDAWHIAEMTNHLFVKPKKKQPDTNLTLLTDKRVYNFELIGITQDKINEKELIYQVTFKYPKEEAARIAAENEAKKLQEKMNKEDNPGPLNWAYWGKGSEETQPNRVYDNGRFTFFTFANNKEKPAIYILNNETGEESLVNTDINPTAPDTIIVHKIASHFVLRKGSYVTCIFNEHYDKNGYTNTNATTVKDVKRSIKSVPRNENDNQ